MIMIKYELYYHLFIIITIVINLRIIHKRYLDKMYFEIYAL